LNGVEVHRLPVEHRRGSVLRYAWEYAAFTALALLKVASLHLRRRFQVVEVDNMPDILLLSALVPRLTGARLIFYVFDNMPELLQVTRGVGPRHPLFRLLATVERLAATVADRVVVTQEIARRIMQSRGIPANKLTVVLNSADEAIFTPRPPRGRPRRRGEAFEIVSHGVILERYGLQVLIDALPEIAQEIPEVRVQIFGEGEYRAELEARARRNGVAHLVRFRGFVPQEELLESLSHADLGYVGMLCDVMLSNKLMEYVALGVPVVLSRWPTFEHYFPDDAVTYFQPGRPDDLARAIRAIYQDPERARARAERAAALYAGYRWSVQREVYLGIYAELLGAAAARSSPASLRSLG
jgi:glycosyltransferase involved in cell wall biosynthesis